MDYYSAGKPPVWDTCYNWMYLKVLHEGKPPGAENHIPDDPRCMRRLDGQVRRDRKQADESRLGANDRARGCQRHTDSFPADENVLKLTVTWLHCVDIWNPTESQPQKGPFDGTCMLAQSLKKNPGPWKDAFSCGLAKIFVKNVCYNKAICRSWNFPWESTRITVFTLRFMSFQVGSLAFVFWGGSPAEERGLLCGPMLKFLHIMFVETYPLLSKRKMLSRGCLLSSFKYVLISPLSKKSLLSSEIKYFLFVNIKGSF